jgi:hypothetical protein
VLTICASGSATGSSFVAGQSFALGSPCGVEELELELELETFLRAGTVVERTVDSRKA